MSRTILILKRAYLLLNKIFFYVTIIIAVKIPLIQLCFKDVAPMSEEKQFRCRAEVEASFTPEEKAVDSTPLTAKEKLQNFWYYYKWHTIIGLFIAFVLIFGVAQCTTKEEPDYTVMTVFDKYVPSEVTGKIEDYLEQFGEDINGDGKVVVHIYDASASDDRDIQNANSTRLMAELQRGEVMLFIVDEDNFSRLDNLNVFEKYPDFKDKDGYALNLRYSNLTDELNSVREGFINHDYYVAKRVLKGTDYENTEKFIKSEEKNLKLLDKFIDSLTFKNEE